jgi:hypothetical protein
MTELAGDVARITAPFFLVMVIDVTELNVFLLKGDHVTIPFSTFGVFVI